MFGAVERRPAGVLLLVRWHGAVTQDRPVALVVITEQAGGEVVAAPVPLAPLRIDLYLHRVAPVWPGPPGMRADISRVSSAPHSSSPTACRSGVTRALPIASSRQKWANAFGDSAGSSSPPAWATRTSSAIQSARSPT